MLPSGPLSSLPSLAIVCSSAAPARLGAAHRFIESFEPSAELLLVGETRDAVDDFVRDVVETRGAVFGLHRLSLRQLAASLAAAELALRGLAIASPLSTEAVCTRAAFEALAADELDYLAPVAWLRSMGRTLAATLGDLRNADIDLSQLDAHGARGIDVRVLADRYEEQLSQSALVDRATLFRIAAHATAGRCTVPVTAPLVLLDVAVHDQATLEFVRALTGRAAQAMVTVPSGDDRTLAAVTSIPGSRDVEAVSPQEGSDAPLDRVRRYLFSPARPPEPSSVPSEDVADVRLFSAPGEGRECVEIARAALLEAARGVRFDRIAILVRAPDLYAGLIETALGRAGIAGWFVRGTRIPDPAGRAYLALLACAAEQLSARRFAEYLSLAQVPSLTDEGAPPQVEAVWVPPDNAGTDLPGQAVPTQMSLFDPPPTSAEEAASMDGPVIAGSLRTPLRWDRLLVESAVIGGRDRWARRLDGMARELGLRLDECAREEPGSARVRALDRDRRDLEHLRRFALPVIDQLAALPDRATWGEWLDHLERLAPRVLKQPERVLSVLGELRPMSRVGPVPLGEVRDVLSTRLTGLQSDPEPRRYGRIFVGRPEHARGRRFDVVFVPGLAERIFPEKQRQDPLLLDDVRIALNATSGIGDAATLSRLGLPTQDDRASDERLLLRLAVGAATRRLYLSYPRLQLSESRPRVPSFYALDVERARRGRVPDFSLLAQDAYREASARLAWPAPDDPNSAVDDTEHDLAVLGPLLRRDVTPEIKGRARYLLHLNPGLRRSLLTRWARWKRPWSRFDGLCDPSVDAQNLLNAHRVTARPYSVSALQRFAVCPYQFFLSTILRLEPREDIEPLEKMDPLTRGRMFHEVQAAFTRELQGRHALPVTLPNVADAEVVLDATLDRISAAYRDELAPAIDRIWVDEIESMRADLKGWIHRVAEEAGDWIPIHAEFGFGFAGGSGRDPDSVPDPVTLDGKWLLHGIVDLIEAKAGPTSEGELRVTDHKTGRNRTAERMVVGQGEVLQPVLYGLAVERALDRPVQTSRLFFSTLNGGYGSRPVSLGPSERRQGIEVIEVVDRAIEAGELLPAPRAGACGWCDFRDVCGPWEEKRVGWKDEAKLGDLMALRRMP